MKIEISKEEFSKFCYTLNNCKVCPFKDYCENKYFSDEVTFKID